MNDTESNFNEWHMERSDLKTEVKIIKKINNERAKEIKTLKSENRRVREELSD